MIRDLKLGIRSLRRDKAFTAIAGTTLALGIGISSAMFSLVNAVLIHPLPYSAPERLVRVWSSWTGDLHGSLSVAEYLDYERDNKVFDAIALHRGRRVNLAWPDGTTEGTYVEEVSGRFFQTLGVEAQRGRYILPEDDTAPGERVVVVSHDFWKRRMGGADVVGRTLSLGGTSFNVIGVMPPSFQYPFRQIGLWVPAGLDVTKPGPRGNRYCNVLARLKPDVTLSQAESRMEATAVAIQRAHPDHYPVDSGWGVHLERLQDFERAPYRTNLLLLLAAVGFLFLIACANVANLLLAKASTRSREAALRAALGASQARIVRQFLAETAVLSLAGGLSGLVLAEIFLRVLVWLNADVIPRSSEAHLDANVAVFTLGAVILAALIAGLAPALRAARWNLSELLSAALRQSQAPGQGKTSRVLLLSEVALATLLLTGAGLLAKTLVHLQNAGLGFEIDHVVTAQLLLEPERYAAGPDITAFYQQVFERLRDQAAMAAAVSIRPLAFNLSDQEVTVEGVAPTSSANRFEQYRVVTPGYFEALAIPINVGRDFSELDSATSQPVALVSRSFSQKYWGDGNPIGRRIRLGKTPWKTVVGVVGDILEGGGAEPIRPILYVPLAQDPTRSMTVVARSVAEPEKLAGKLRTAVSSIDPSQAIDDLGSLQKARWDSNEEPRFNTELLGFFALLALFLSAAGLYGLVSHLVSGRRYEIGVRTALGAQRRDIVVMVVSFGIKWTVLGLVLGSVGAILLFRYMESLVVAVKTTDPWNLLTVWMLLLATALAACYFPARRAARTDPWKALREQ